MILKIPHPSWLAINDDAMTRNDKPRSTTAVLVIPKLRFVSQRRDFE